MDVFTNSKVREILREFNQNQISVVMEVFCETHLAIFIPLRYLKVEPINIVFSEEMDGTRLQDLSF